MLSTDGATPTTDSPPANTTGATAPPTTGTADDDPCDRTDTIDELEVDLDGDELGERITLVADGADTDSAAIALCAEGSIAAATVEGTNQAIAGVVDLDHDGTGEILLTRDTESGDELRAVALTLRGLQLTSLAIERQIDLPDGATVGSFTGRTYDCEDWDADGNLELLVWRFRPAGDLENVSASVVELDGLEPVEGPLDQFETTHEEALAMWRQAGDCAPGARYQPRVDFSEAGWARVPVDPSVFTGDEDLVFTAVAASEGRLVAVGTHAPEIAIGELTAPVPLAWWSTDGIEWTAASVQGEDAEILDVARTRDGFIAVGRTGDDAASWTSRDGGEWSLNTFLPDRKEHSGSPTP